MRKTLILSILIIFCFSLSVSSVLAVTPDSVQDSINGLERAQDKADLPQADLYKAIGKLIGYLLNIASIILLIVVVYGGITWMTAGTDEGVKKARSMIIQAIIGLAVTLSAYGLTYYIFARILVATAT